VDINQSVPFQLLDQAIGIDLEIISNDFQETPGGPNHSPSTYQEIVFQIKEEEPDLSAIGVLYALSLMSFSYAAPRGYSAEYFIPDEQWSLGYFVQGLEFRHKFLCFSADYVSGRMMKTDILFQSGGKVNLSTRNRGRGAERWLTHLQGKKHIHVVEK
jgi:hypothetical protein